MFSARATSAAVLLLFPVVPAFGQQQEPVVADFLTTIGGDTSVKTVGADKNPAAPQVQPPTSSGTVSSRRTWA